MPLRCQGLRYLTPLRYGQPLDPIESYEAHFRGCGPQTYAMEATPGYFYGGEELARGLHRLSPSARAIVSLREPGERCWSWFRFVKSRTRIPKDMPFKAYLDRCEELHDVGTDGDYENQPFWGLGGGCYATWLEAWAKEFEDRFRILFFDEIVDDPGVRSKRSATGSPSTTTWSTASSFRWTTRPSRTETCSCSGRLCS